MLRRAEKLADRVVLDRLHTGQCGTAPGPDQDGYLNGGIPWRKRSDPARGIMLGMAIGIAAWVLIGLAVLAWSA